MSVIALGVFLAGLLVFLLLGMAFHADVPDAVSRQWGILLFFILLPAIIVMAAAGMRTRTVMARELARGYTTLRFIDSGMEIRDRRGRVIPRGDPRLRRSHWILRLLTTLAPVLLGLSGFLWVLRLLVISSQ